MGLRVVSDRHHLDRARKRSTNPPACGYLWPFESSPTKPEVPEEVGYLEQSLLGPGILDAATRPRSAAWATALPDGGIPGDDIPVTPAANPLVQPRVLPP